jgi:hypothetical protein
VNIEYLEPELKEEPICWTAVLEEQTLKNGGPCSQPDAEGRKEDMERELNSRQKKGCSSIGNPL